MWLAIDEVLLNYSVISPERQGKGTKGNKYWRWSYSSCALHFLLLYEVVLNSNQYLLSYAPDKEKYQRAVTLYFVKMELWLLCTALPFNVLDNCMKLYWIPNSSFQVMLWTRKSNKGNNSVISQDGVLVLVHCTSSQCAWPLYEVILNSNH
jgi:hypothetical protein